MQLAKRLRYFRWLVAGILSRYNKTILFAFVIGLILFIVGFKALPIVYSHFKYQTKIVAIVGQYTPSSLPPDIERLVSSGLTDITQSGDAVPALATSWDVSADGKKYTFHLKNNVLWHDKKKFVAGDINYNLREVEFVPIDDETLVVKLKEPFTPLPIFLSKPLFRKGLIGVGSYKIDVIQLKGEFVSYLKLAGLATDLPPIEIKFFTSDSAAKTAFKLGEVNSLSDLADPTPFMDWKNVVVTAEPQYNQYVAVFFNTTDETLKNKEVRQALTLTVDKPQENRISSPISTKSWAFTTRVKTYDKDVQAAKDLIGSDKIKLTLSTVPQYISLAQQIAAAWKELGVETTVKVENGIPSDYQALLITQEIPFDPDQYTFWHSTQGQTNLSRYANPKIDKLLEDGRRESDQEKRKRIYYDFQRYLVDDAPAIFLFNPTTYTIARKN